MKIGFTLATLLVTLLAAVVLGFSLGMIVAGHSDWECMEASSGCGSPSD